MTYRQRSAHLRSKILQLYLACKVARPVQKQREVAQTENFEARVGALLALFTAEVDADDAVFVGWMRAR